MKAATVSGPRSRIRATRDSGLAASVLLHRDERFAIAAPDEDLGDPARLHLLQRARRFARTRHGPAVHREDHVARPQPSGRRPVRLDVRNHRTALSGWQPEPARQLRRHVVERQTKTARTLLVVPLRIFARRAAAGALFGFEIELVN